MNTQTALPGSDTTAEKGAMGGLLRPAASLFIVLSLITGLLYPLLTAGIASALFPSQAEGSFVRSDGRIVGSTLIGQSFTGPNYFWSRPSATAPQPYNAAASSGSNQGPLNPALVDAVRSRLAALRSAHPERQGPVPVDLVTASGSGLDPHISVAAANYQVERVARARNLPASTVQAIVDGHIAPRQLGLFGEARVNVLELNLALDAAGKP